MVVVVESLILFWVEGVGGEGCKGWRAYGAGSDAMQASSCRRQGGFNTAGTQHAAAGWWVFPSSAGLKLCRGHRRNTLARTHTHTYNGVCGRDSGRKR